MDFLDGINVLLKSKHMKIVKKQVQYILKIQLYAIIKQDNFKLAIIIKRIISLIKIKSRANMFTNIQ